MTAAESTFSISAVSKTARLPVLDSLRGVAALSVVWCHLAGFGIFAPSASYGWLGVYVFFVISGFILPYTLFQADYKTADYGRFLLKRICRIDPPYFLSIALEIAFVYLASLSPIFDVHTPRVTWAQILMHVGYLNAFTGGQWIVIVFWTLGVEFQYYLLIGIMFPILAGKFFQWELVFYLPILALLWSHHSFPIRAYADHGGLIVPYLFVFLIGIFTFQYRSHIIAKRQYLIRISTSALCAAACQGPLISAVSLVTGLLIAFANFRSRTLEFVGVISYSLYLVHTIVGTRVERLMNRLIQNDSGPPIALLAGMGASILAAYFMYRWVERPSLALAKAIAYSSSAANASVERLAVKTL